jgi:hypothetical protein
MFSPIFQYSIFLAKWISGTEPEPVSHSEYQVDAPKIASVALLPGMVRAGQAMRTDGFLIPKVFILEVSYVRSLLSQPAHTTFVPLSKTNSLSIPAREASPKAICFIGLDALFSALSLANIVRAVSVMLLEKHVVVVSNCPNKLTLSVLCLKELCKPFNLRCTFLPLLPATPEFLSFLDSPVPFVLGILRGTHRIEVGAYVVVVDLDADTVTDPDRSPLLPGAPELIDRLKATLDLNKAEIVIPRPSVNMKTERAARMKREWAEFVKTKMHPFSVPFIYWHYQRKYIFTESVIEDIICKFRVQIAPPLEQLLSPCFITDTTDIDNPVTVFNNDLFMASVKPADQPFYRAFLSTSAFHEYSDSLMEETAKSASPRCPSFSSPSLRSLAGGVRFSPQIDRLSLSQDDERLGD